GCVPPAPRPQDGTSGRPRLLGAADGTDHHRSATSARLVDGRQPRPATDVTMARRTRQPRPRPRHHRTAGAAGHGPATRPHGARTDTSHHPNLRLARPVAQRHRLARLVAGPDHPSRTPTRRTPAPRTETPVLVLRHPRHCPRPTTRRPRPRRP